MDLGISETEFKNIRELSKNCHTTPSKMLRKGYVYTEYLTRSEMKG